jgi:hypothetical protein
MIRHSASTVNRSSPPPGNTKNGARSGGWLLLFTVLAEWRIMMNNAYAKNNGDGLLCSILWCWYISTLISTRKIYFFIFLSGVVFPHNFSFSQFPLVSISLYITRKCFVFVKYHSLTVLVSCDTVCTRKCARIVHVGKAPQSLQQVFLI